MPEHVLGVKVQEDFLRAARTTPVPKDQKAKQKPKQQRQKRQDQQEDQPAASAELQLHSTAGPEASASQLPSSSSQPTATQAQRQQSKGSCELDSSIAIQNSSNAYNNISSAIGSSVACRRRSSSSKKIDPSATAAAMACATSTPFCPTATVGTTGTTGTTGAATASATAIASASASTSNLGKASGAKGSTSKSGSKSGGVSNNNNNNNNNDEGRAATAAAGGSVVRKKKPVPGRDLAHCKWCREPMYALVCAQCINEERERVVAARRAPPEFGRRPTQLLERQQALRARLQELTLQLESREAKTAEMRRTLDERKRKCQERRSSYQAKKVQLAAAKRALDAKRPKLSREEFLKGAGHAPGFSAFHEYQELSVVTSALQERRRQRCAQLVNIFPVRRFNASSEAVTLGNVHSLLRPGELKEDDLHDISAAISFLLPLLTGLSAILDVSLPFPVTNGRGAEVDFDSNNYDMTGSTFGVAQAIGPVAMRRARPCVQQPTTEHWWYLSLEERSCTPDFEQALKVVDQDLLALCRSQGDPAMKSQSTLQLLGHLLASANLGCPILCAQTSAAPGGTSSTAMPPLKGIAPPGPGATPGFLNPGTATALATVTAAAAAAATATAGEAAGRRIASAAKTASKHLAGNAGRPSKPSAKPAVAAAARHDEFDDYEDGDWTVVLDD